jgi:hypothetical protein
MKGIDSTGAPLVHVPGWMGGRVEVKTALRIAYSNHKYWNDHWPPTPSTAMVRMAVHGLRPKNLPLPSSSETIEKTKN